MEASVEMLRLKINNAIQLCNWWASPDIVDVKAELSDPSNPLVIKASTVGLMFVSAEVGVNASDTLSSGLLLVPDRRPFGMKAMVFIVRDFGAPSRRVGFPNVSGSAIVVIERNANVTSA